MDEEVDILAPPLFEKTGRTEARAEAYSNGDWIATFNLWIVRRTPEPALLYQIRSPQKTWAPNKLDVPAGGHYLAGERLHDGLREVREELGKAYDPEQLTYLGRKLYVGRDEQGGAMHNVIELYLVEDESPLEAYKLQAEEVYAICSCPISELIRAHTDKSYSFETQVLTADGKTRPYTVRGDSFPENWDNYHLKIALLAQRFLAGEKHLIY